MDTHKNAPLTPKGREAIVHSVVEGGLSYAAAARQFNTTPKTVAKWVKRFRGEGVDGLREPVQKFDLGVLMVHGIGTPPAGDTLVRWGDVLLKTIRLATQKNATQKNATQNATQNKVEVKIEHAAPENWAGMDRLEAVVRLSFGDHTEEWLLREGWWANTFPLPSYRELVSWTEKALPWAIVTFVGVDIGWFRRLSGTGSYRRRLGRSSSSSSPYS